MSMSLVCFSNTIPTMPSAASNLRYPQLKSNFVISKPSFQVKCTQLSASHPMEGRKFDGWDHETELSVRDYELDQFGVVNNAVYANYCQQGRHEFMNVSCSTNADMIARGGYAIAMAESAYKFIAPLRSGDRFLVKLKIRGWSKTRFFIEQFIVKLPDEEPILEATSTIVMLDRNYRPIRIPPLVLFEVKEFCYQRRGPN